jgi:hypothetical protein
MVIETQIKVFPEGSRKASLEIKSLVPRRAIDALAERLGVEIGQQAEAALKSMKRNNMDMVQLRLDDKRIRIAQVA